MRLKFLYYYYVTDNEELNIKEIIDYLSNSDTDIDTILDKYSERKKNRYSIDVYYLLTDIDDQELTKLLVITTESDKRFRGWIQIDSDEYKYIDEYFREKGILDKALEKVINYRKTNDI
jgi:hypothetical protein